MKSFTQFKEETTKLVTITFGRFSPPTIGHLKLIDKVASLARGKDFFIYASQSEDPKKNPLPYKDKVKYMQKMFPKYAKRIVYDKDIKTPIDALQALSAAGYTRVQIVVGSDRLKSFEFVHKYNGVKTDTGIYTFVDGIEILSAGERDPDADDVVSAMSASKLRAAAADGDIDLFSTGMPDRFSDTLKLFNDIRKGMNMKPITAFRESVILPKQSNVREQYLNNEILRVGSLACSLKDNSVIIIRERKTNFVIDYAGKKHFIQDLVPTTQE